jgi:signal transduction histidine kinase
MVGAPLLILGLLLVLTAIVGGRIEARRWGAVAGFVLSPLTPAAWRATGSIALGFVVELVSFATIVSIFSTGTSLLVIGVGFLLLGLGIEASRLVARAERWRLSHADVRPLVAHDYRPYGSGLRDLLEAVFLDVNRWRDVIYVLVAFPLTLLELLASMFLWVAAIGLLALPVAWAATEPLPGSIPGASAGAVVAVGAVAGAVVAMAAASASRGLLALHRAVVAGLLCVNEASRLQQRVETLEGSRRAVLDVEASELRRIERDLHDGAQQRLVVLTMDLGLAAERIETDPAAARSLVLEAQDQARQTLADLRNLVRGIAPAILLDRGLVPALSALAARSPVSTVVLSSMLGTERLPDSVERAAYFVVAEALANAGKHAHATRCEVRCRRDPDQLVVEVWDDGGGGARMAPSGGLTGLAGRIEALDGRLEVESPAGGPTIVRAEIPVPPAAGIGPGSIDVGAPAPTGWPAVAPPMDPGTGAVGGIPGWRPPDEGAGPALR